MKRIVASVLGIAAVTAAFAQKAEVLGAAPEKSAPLVDGMALVQLCAALGIVYCLIRFVFPRLMAKLG
ncbi:MAG: hypothetical protein ABUL72_00645, partial [Armatimonadota bacterium]